MKKEPKVSILMLNWNGIAYTKKSITSLLQSTYTNFEIIILDNGSKYNEAEKLENEFVKNKKNKSTSIKVIRNKTNVGYAAGMNIAFTYATGEYVMIVNNDMEFEKNCIKELSAALSKYPQVAICQPKLKHLTHKDEFDYAVAAGGYFDIFGYPFARGRIFTYVEKDTGQYDTVAKIGWCGIFMAKKNVLEKTGLFDTIYFNYGEDMDLCYRIYKFGYVIINIPNAVGYHQGGGILKKNLYQKMFFHHRNNLIFIIKNFELKIVISILGPRIVLDFISIFYYLYNMSLVSALAVINAYISLISLSGKIVTARKLVHGKFKKKKSIQLPIYKGSIIWDYFIMRKRTFKEIVKDKNLYTFS